MIIHNKFVGGNIFVDRIEGNHVYLRNEQRDSTENWFYWAFCIEGAAGRELTFHFEPAERGRYARLGFWGPAVSHDLVSWHWLDDRDGNNFTYRFGETEDRVYFAHDMLYHPAHFFEFARRKNLPVEEFSRSRKGNSVPCLKLGEGDVNIILTARHHSCESSGSYVLEGIADELTSNPIENTRVLVVPFVDLDGVVDGDHGKHRAPRKGYNAEYHPDTGAIYPETQAIIAYAEQYGAHYAFDFHSPSHWTKEHDHIYVMRSYKAEAMDRFSEILVEEYVEGGMHYSPQWNQPAKPREVVGPAFNSYMNHRPENVLAFTMECTYAGLAENKVSQERLRIFGKSFANALRRFVKETRR